MTKLVACVIAIALLLALFTLPCYYLCNAADDITALAEHALQAVLDDDWEAARRDMLRMQDQLDGQRATLHLFLNHEAVEGLEIAVSRCLRLTQIQDKPQAVMELEFILIRAEHLKSIEDFALSVLI